MVAGEFELGGGILKSEAPAREASKKRVLYKFYFYIEFRIAYS